MVPPHEISFLSSNHIVQSLSFSFFCCLIQFLQVAKYSKISSRFEPVYLFLSLHQDLLFDSVEVQTCSKYLKVHPDLIAEGWKSLDVAGETKIKNSNLKKKNYLKLFLFKKTSFNFLMISSFDNKYGDSIFIILVILNLILKF